jgi:hypothetical protein
MILDLIIFINYIHLTLRYNLTHRDKILRYLHLYKTEKKSSEINQEITFQSSTPDTA